VRLNVYGRASGGVPVLSVSDIQSAPIATIGNQPPAEDGDVKCKRPRYGIAPSAARVPIGAGWMPGARVAPPVHTGDARFSWVDRKPTARWNAGVSTKKRREGKKGGKGRKGKRRKERGREGGNVERGQRGSAAFRPHRTAPHRAAPRRAARVFPRRGPWLCSRHASHARKLARDRALVARRPRRGVKEEGERRGGGAEERRRRERKEF